jgi:anthranilate/para-aminobenzoate synthase component I
LRLNLFRPEVVAHTISGYPVDKEEYVAMVKEADERISSGEYTTINLEKKSRSGNMQKPITILWDTEGKPI